MKKLLAIIFGIIFVFTGNFLLTSCGDNHHYEDETDYDSLLTFFDPNLPTGTLEFTDSIMNLSDFDRIIPLGQLNPPGHTFPTDHIYFVLNGTAGEIYAPCGGKILYIGEPGVYGDRAVRIGVTSTMAYYLDHILLDTELKVGDTVVAGSQIGTKGNTPCVDFGVINKNVINAFISEDYPTVTLYGDKPLSFYAEPLRTQLYAMVKPAQPTEEPDYVYDKGVTDGEFVFDQLGTLCGNWVKEVDDNSGTRYEWENTLAFGYDVYYPDQIRIGIGTSSNAFALNNSDNPIRPEDVNTSSGAVAFYLYNANNVTNEVFLTGREKLMMVQLLSDTRLKLEIFDDTTSVSREFTSASIFYVR